jgi:spore coat protein U-like protein
MCSFHDQRCRNATHEGAAPNVRSRRRTTVSVALDGGLSGAANPTLRKMTLGAGSITHGLCQDVGHANPWGSSSGANVVNGTGASLSQPIPVYGLVPVQATPPVGTYSDTVVVSVTY